MIKEYEREHRSAISLATALSDAIETLQAFSKDVDWGKAHLQSQTIYMLNEVPGRVNRAFQAWFWQQDIR